MIHPYVNSKPGVGYDNDCSTCGGKFRDSVHGATDEERFKYSAQPGVAPQYSRGQTMLFQILSRNNDTNGNPYRLMLCYDSEGTVTAAYEARRSMPNKASELSQTHRQLPTFHLAPSEYNKTRKTFSNLIEKAN